MTSLVRNASAGDVAAALNLSTDSIGRYAREGRIPFAQTPGGHRRYNIAEVRQALAPAGTTVSPELFPVPSATLRRRHRRALHTPAPLEARGIADQPARPSAAIEDLVTPAKQVLRVAATV